MRTRQLGGRRSAAALASLSAAAVGLAGLTTPASAVVAADAVAADDPASCATPYTGTLVRGQALTGKTVTQGTVPEPFTGTVIGTLKDGIAPGTDMILADLAGSESVDRHGVWAGMSGSPVYVDGQLVGAVSYTLNEGKTSVAGITPAAAVLAVRDGDVGDVMGAQARRTQLGATMAGRVAASGAATRSQAASGMRALPSPIAVSGLSPRRFAQLEGWLDDLGPVTNAGASSQVAAAAEGPGREAIVNGGNIVASLGYGYVAAAATGTVTDVCDDEVAAFGHPFTYGGRSTLGLHAADAVGIIPPGLFSGFKLANAGAPIGTIDNDRLAGISGSIGATPDYVPVTAMASDQGGREVGGTTFVSVADLVADAGLATAFTANDRALDRYGKGTATSSWTVTATGSDGVEQTLTWEDVYASGYDVASAPVTGLAQQLYTLLENETEEVAITGIDVDTDFTSEVAQQLRIGRTFQVVKGKQKQITRKAPAVVKAGTTGTVLVELYSKRSRDAVLVPVSVSPSKKSAGRTGILTVEGAFYGDDDWYFYFDEDEFFDEYGDEMLGGTRGESLAETIERIEGQAHNDDLVTRFAVRGTPVAKGRTSAGSTPAAAGNVVSGFVAVPVKVVR